ncbi:MULTISPECIES: class I SAM-dependent methyltransferase [unclassified Bradyrhizobium]|uniref:class I SAM-dependent methyltransferase n=1 Tax=unclassified Bradyrhizobium TaxID=2631580 RepID=UPI001FF700C0|nr:MULTISPECIES: class I SAM-dependent methyltransferase [unclassified Bradyrhizobium]MCK1534623.1 methyltransferase domain-containing protein [Bradyrhizobium sp. 176]MCK1557860.1 methyltransferase domain-containing protein [Bradyrhizobium sp. 171]UPJ98289.1 methyltransferase domain-containing protein [Bradyrhizobium sp. 172]
MKCRHCQSQLTQVFLDLGHAPPSNAYLSQSALRAPETTYPLKLFVCNACWLVQTEDYAGANELFSDDYAYFSSTSKGWLTHARAYCNKIAALLGLGKESFVIEVASNDGYLLQNFVTAGIPCLGVEPTASTADAAEKIGVPVLRKFFGVDTATTLADEGKQADLICGNNVYAHVPDINDFTNGLQVALKPGGTINLEFPHLKNLIEQNQFDTVYHEHFSYLSLIAVVSIFERAGLRIFDVERLPTHGGSLRIYGCHKDDPRAATSSVTAMIAEEEAFGLKDISLYRSFQQKADKVKNDFIGFLIEQKRAGKSVAAYGAAAKGNTLMNYAGIRPDLISFICDAAPSKQTKFMPGSHIPILHPDEITKRRPDWVVILPWNIAPEVMQQVQIKSWGGQFVIAVPEIKVLA